MQKDVLLQLVSRAIAVKGSWMLKKDEAPGSRVRPFSGFCLAIRQGTDVFYTQYLGKLCDVERAVFCGGPGVAKVRVKFTNSLPLESIYSRLRDLKYCRLYYLFRH